MYTVVNIYCDRSIIYGHHHNPFCIDCLLIERTKFTCLDYINMILCFYIRKTKLKFDPRILMNEFFMSVFAPIFFSFSFFIFALYFKFYMVVMSCQNHIHIDVVVEIIQIHYFFCVYNVYVFDDHLSLSSSSSSSSSSITTTTTTTTTTTRRLIKNSRTSSSNRRHQQ
ncbi:hypothetical protein DERF_006627 [Dermatophagoides farinae]|uniref:Uncharacterized protein n=1 Tax=Dermatophagoides farinae TaxID=6954 RepID=A0A922HXH5_DERFA|nr:hypothetical protein DERF_006627 [Dermatophagoides farinae]